MELLNQNRRKNGTEYVDIDIDDALLTEVVVVVNDNPQATITLYGEGLNLSIKCSSLKTLFDLRKSIDRCIERMRPHETILHVAEAATHV